MSAHILDPEAIGLLAASVLAYRAITTHYDHSIVDPVVNPVVDPVESQRELVKKIAQDLAKENIRSVACRYPNDVSGQRPGPCLSDENIVLASALYAEHFFDISYARSQVEDLQILRLINAYDYQACETSDWTSTPQYEQLQWLKDAVIRDMPGYDEAQWSIANDERLESVNALYQQEQPVAPTNPEQLAQEAARNAIARAQRPRG